MFKRINIRNAIIVGAILFMVLSGSCIPFSSFAFPGPADHVDSLKQLLHFKEGIEKADVLISLAEHYSASEPDSALYYTGRAVAIREITDKQSGEAYRIRADALFYKRDYEKAIEYYTRSAEINKRIYGDRSMSYAERLGDIGYCNMILVKYDQALVHYQKALKIARINHDADEISNNLNNIGNIFFHWGNYDSTITYFLQALEIDKKLGNREYICTDYNNIAKVYETWEKFDQALEYYRKSLAMAKELEDENRIAIRYSNMGNIHKNLGNYDEALSNYSTALEIDRRLGNERKTGVRLSRLGEIYLLKEEYDLAQDYFNEAHRIFLKTAQMESEAIVLGNLGKLYMATGQYPGAEAHYMASLRIADSMGLTAIGMAAVKGLSDLMEETGQYRRSLRFYKKYNQIRDSIFTAQKHRQLAEFQALYETEKKQQQIELLNREKKIRTMELERSENVRVFFIVVSILLIILAGVIYSRFRLKSKTNALLSRKNEELTMLNATKDKFFSIIAHDLKNHLSGFLSISRSLNENAPMLSTEEITYFTRELHESSTRLHDLLTNLLQWARSQTGSLRYSPEARDLKSLIDENFRLMKTAAGEKKISLINNIRSDTQIYADSNMINTVLRNLISNAIKFTEPGGKVELQAREGEGNVEVSVADTGIGMDREDVEKLFRIDVDTSAIGLSKEKGTGLGLILCHELIRKNRGDIGVESEPGIGSRFVFSVPAGG